MNFLDIIIVVVLILLTLGADIIEIINEENNVNGN